LVVSTVTVAVLVVLSAFGAAVKLRDPLEGDAVSKFATAAPRLCPVIRIIGSTRPFVLINKIAEHLIFFSHETWSKAELRVSIDEKVFGR